MKYMFTSTPFYHVINNNKIHASPHTDIKVIYYNIVTKLLTSICNFIYIVVLYLFKKNNNFFKFQFKLKSFSLL